MYVYAIVYIYILIIGREVESFGGKFKIQQVEGMLLELKQKDCL